MGRRVYKICLQKIGIEVRKMEYECWNCGHVWDLHLGILDLPRCPNFLKPENKPCRSYNVWPRRLPQIIEKAKEFGISDNTPVKDFVNAAAAVGVDSLLLLGCREFRRVQRKVIREVENSPFRRSRISIKP